MSEPAASDRKRRTNRFDRPKEPHDWRWAVGTLGRILIAIGLLMFAFVSYQLWGTGIQTAQAQNRLENEFEGPSRIDHLGPGHDDDGAAPDDHDPSGRVGPGRVDHDRRDDDDAATADHRGACRG